MDTSAWVELLRPPPPAVAEPSLDSFATCGPVLQELFQGIPERPGAAELRSRLLALPRIGDPLPAKRFLEAADLYRRGRAHGYTIRSAMDCLIAALAIHANLPVLHCDRDYDLLARFTPLRAVRFPADM